MSWQKILKSADHSWFFGFCVIRGSHVIPKWVVNTFGIAFGDFWVVRVEERFRPPQFSAGERWDGQPLLLRVYYMIKWILKVLLCMYFVWLGLECLSLTAHSVFGNNWFLGAIFIVFVLECWFWVCCWRSQTLYLVLWVVLCDNFFAPVVMSSVQII